jgi:hypothetical protein
MEYAMRKSLTIVFGAGLFLAAATSPAQASGPYSFYGVAPCRIVDTRNPDGPVGGPALLSGNARSFPVIGYCNVPSTAKAVTLNVTLVSPTVNGFITLYPVGGLNPSTSNVNANAGTSAIANAVVTLLSSGTGGTNVTAVFGSGQSGTAHLLIDVTGYFQ